MKIAVPYFESAEYEKLLRVAADRALLPPTYVQFVERVERHIETVLRWRYQIERVNVHVGTLVRWCRARGLPVSGAARQRYATMLLALRGANGQR